jgi:hypothetical protein
MPIDPEPKNCSDCRFFIDDEDLLNGECHRNPPRVRRHVNSDERRNAGVWPAVCFQDWCGEFQGKSQ